MNRRILQVLVIVFAVSQMAFFNIRTLFDNPKYSELKSIERIKRSVTLIQYEYYDKSRVKPKKMLEEGFFELAKEVPEVLPVFDGQKLVLKLGSKEKVLSIGGVNDLGDLLFPVNSGFEFIKKNYKGEVKYADMEYAFIAGMVSVLDPHSNILTPKVFEEFKTQTSGEYGGLGIVIGLKDNELAVVSPLDDTPAFRAGILADDKILQIDDQSTTNMSLNEAVDLMRGKPGTKVVLKIKSKNKDDRFVTLVREVIEIKSIQTKLVKKDNKNIAIIRIKGFQEETYPDMVKGIRELRKQAFGRLDGIILDLRNNPGGLLDQAILIADKFLESGEIVLTAGPDEIDTDVAYARKQNSDILLPTIVLIDEGSASASEIVAGALKNNNRAIIMGRKSFGKGSVQSLFSLRDGSSLKLTVAQYLTPGKVSIQAVGIQPDIHLYPSIVGEDFFDLHEDLYFGEEKLDAHLQNVSKGKQVGPLYHFTYLKTEKKKIESHYTSKIRENEDMELKLATTILSKIKVGTKKEILKQVDGILKEESKIQDQEIVVALKKKSIDWSDIKDKRPLTLESNVQFYDLKGNLLNDLLAGTEVKLRVTLKNIGEKSNYRVLAEVDSLNPLLNHKEFVFGKIEPGSQVFKEVKIKVPSEIINFKEDAKLKIYSSGNEESPKVVAFTTEFTEKTPPILAYQYQIIDNGQDGSRGNGNGIPEKGESIIFVAKVKNIGQGESTNTVINIKNEEGNFVFLKKARETIGVLKSGQMAAKKLKFNIKENFNKDEFKIKFFAIDSHTKTSISDTLKFDLKKHIAIDPKPLEYQQSPIIEVADNSKQMGNLYEIAGKVLDNKRLNDLAIFVKGKKIFYKDLKDIGKDLSYQFDVKLPLEDGLNAIVIQARGYRNIVSQKSLIVVYSDPTKVAKTK